MIFNVLFLPNVKCPRAKMKRWEKAKNFGAINSVNFAHYNFQKLISKKNYPITLAYFQQKDFLNKFRPFNIFLTF
jgi:hypothetical protein